MISRLNTKRQPLVSVIMPVYNYGKYVKSAIESILNQTYSNLEFIIIDDASTDNSYEIVCRYKKQYPKKIKVIHLKKNLNCGGDRCANQGLKIARGKYIARMDSDDIALPTRLEKQVEFLENNPKTFLVGASAYAIDENGNIIGEKIQPESNEEIYKNYFTFHPLIHPSCMYRQKLNNKKKFQYQISYKSNNDYFTFFKIMCKGYKFANLKEKLLYYRIHKESNTFHNIKKVFFTILRIRLSMALNHRYKPTPYAIFSNLAQIILISLLPEKIIIKLYLFFKRITKKQKRLMVPTSTPSLIYD